MTYRAATIALIKAARRDSPLLTTAAPTSSSWPLTSLASTTGAANLTFTPFCAEPSSSTSLTISLSPSSARFSAITRTPGLLTDASAKLRPSGPLCGDCYQARQMDDEIFIETLGDG